MKSLQICYSIRSNMCSMVYLSSDSDMSHCHIGRIMRLTLYYRVLYITYIIGPRGVSGLSQPNESNQSEPNR